MRFINQINEDDELDKLKKDILSECSEILNLYKNTGKLLYRGLKYHDSYGYITPRDDRRPVDTPKEIHNALDKGFKDKFGWKSRSEGVFVTGDNKMTEIYGDTFIFYPVDGWKFIWSPDVNDLYIDFVEGGKLFVDQENKYYDEYGPDEKGYWEDTTNFQHFENTESIKKYWKEQNFKILDINGYQSRRFDMKDNDGRKIYHRYVWRPEVEWMMYREEFMDDTIKNLVRLYKSTDIESAVKSGNEIMFKCSGYYYVSKYSRVGEIK